MTTHLSWVTVHEGVSAKKTPVDHKSDALMTTLPSQAIKNTVKTNIEETTVDL